MAITGKGKPVQNVKGADQGATMAFSVGEPITDKMSPLPATSQRLLQTLRDKFGSWSVQTNREGNEVNTSGIIYPYFVQNLKASSQIIVPKVKLRIEGKTEEKDVKFLIVQTKTTTCLIYDIAPAALLDVDPRLMNLNLDRTAVLETGTGKHVYLSRITPKELDALIAITSAAMHMGKAPSTKIAPDKESGMAVSIPDIQAKLKTCKIVTTTDSNFDLRTFADGIVFACTFNDEQDNPHYFLQAGKEESCYRLYVGNVRETPENFVSLTLFVHGTEHCVLVRET